MNPHYKLVQGSHLYKVTYEAIADANPSPHPPLSKPMSSAAPLGTDDSEQQSLW